MIAWILIQNGISVVMFCSAKECLGASELLYWTVFYACFSDLAEYKVIFAYERKSKSRNLVGESM